MLSSIDWIDWTRQEERPGEGCGRLARVRSPIRMTFVADHVAYTSDREERNTAVGRFINTRGFHFDSGDLTGKPLP